VKIKYNEFSVGDTICYRRNDIFVKGFIKRVSYNRDLPKKEYQILSDDIICLQPCVSAKFLKFRRCILIEKNIF
jgi:hypothetical protein